jgi:hypothetical protein
LSGLGGLIGATIGITESGVYLHKKTLELEKIVVSPVVLFEPMAREEKNADDL